MPKGKYLNADHELIGKLLEQTEENSSMESKIHDVICALCLHHFNLPSGSQLHRFSPTQARTNRVFYEKDIKPIYDYLAIELGKDYIEPDEYYFNKTRDDCIKYLSDPENQSNPLEKKEFNYNIEFSNKYYAESELGIKKENIFAGNLAPEKAKPIEKEQKKVEIKKKITNSFVDDIIENFGETFGPHFKGETIEEIINKDLSRNAISKLFSGDSEQITNVFKAVKELYDPNSELEDRTKAINLKNALDEYLLYKRDGIEAKLNKCETDADRKKLIDNNGVDFRRYEFCRKLAQKMTDLPSEFNIRQNSNHKLDYNKFTAYDNEHDAIANGINRIQKKQRFSFGKFFKEKIVEPISDFFSSISFSRSKSREEPVPTFVSSSSGPSVSKKDVHKQEEPGYKIHIQSKKETINKSKKNIKSEVLQNQLHSALNSEPKKLELNKDNPFTGNDKEMLQDLFINSTGTTDDKLKEIAFLSRLGLIKYENSRIDKLNPVGLLRVPVLNPNHRTPSHAEISATKEFAKAVAKVVGVDKNYMPDSEDFEATQMDLNPICTLNVDENRLAISRNFKSTSERKVFTTGVLKRAANFDVELKNNLEGKKQAVKEDNGFNNEKVIINNEMDGNVFENDFFKQ